MTTLIERLSKLLEQQHPGEWFALTDEQIVDNHRLQIVLHQAARKNKRQVTTRTINGELKACILQ